MVGARPFTKSNDDHKYLFSYQDGGITETVSHRISYRRTTPGLLCDSVGYKYSFVIYGTFVTGKSIYINNYNIKIYTIFRSFLVTSDLKNVSLIFKILRYCY